MADLFVMLEHNKYADLLIATENRVRVLVENRHEYPIWPMHDEAMDTYEQEYHGWIRRPYYASTIFLIQVLRRMRDISSE